MNHILLPQLQKWFKSCADNFEYNDSMTTLKHVAGLTADIIIELFSDGKQDDAKDLILKQSLFVFIQCIDNIDHYHHSIIKLCSSCIR